MDSLVLTPKGFRPMGKIGVGTSVTDPTTGGSAKVIAVYPQGIQPVWRITCDDGAKLEVGLEHLWAYRLNAHTNTRPRIKPSVQRTDAQKLLGREPLRDRWNNYHVGTTAELIALKEAGGSIRLPLTEPVLFTVNGHPTTIDKYLFGLLLGDGHLACPASQVSISATEPEIIGFLQSLGFSRRPSSAHEWVVSGDFSKTLRIWLRNNGLLGVRAATKFIPPWMKTLAVGDRLGLVQGLMDSDGYVDAAGHCFFTTVSRRLAIDLVDLIRGLGGKANIREKHPVYTHNGERRDGQIAYEVRIWLPQTSSLFRMARKRERCTDSWNGGHEITREIVSIEPAGEKECQCIRVDSPYGLYVADDYIVTHNSFCLLLEPLYHITSVPSFGCVAFRRTTPQLRGEGGLWDTSALIYPMVEAHGREADLEWLFPVKKDGKQIARNRLKMSHIEHERNKYDWDSTQIPLILFDQLESFTGSVFWHLVGRNRSTCGVRPYIRASCNPISSGWLHDIVMSFWVGADGYPIAERSGIKRWLIRMGEDILWGDNPDQMVQELHDQYAIPKHELQPLSVAFVPGKPQDNTILMEKDPTYIAKLRALPRVERERLLYGNWKVVAGSGDYFQRAWVGEFLRHEPNDVTRWVRAWDLAGTRPSSQNPDPDWTVGIKMGLRRDGGVVVANVIRRRDSPGRIKELVLRTAEFDGRGVRIVLNKDPGQAGKDQAEDYVMALRGYHLTTVRETGPKEVRFGPFSSAAEHGHVQIVLGPWTGEYVAQLENFPLGHDDDADATSTAYNAIAGRGGRFKLLAPGEQRPEPRTQFRQLHLG